MKKVFSFFKLLEHERLADINMTELYNTLKFTETTYAAREAVASDISLARIDILDMAPQRGHIEVAYHQTDHKTWVAFYPHGSSLSSYAWRTHTHSFDDSKWDTTFTAPEIEAGLDATRHYYSGLTMSIYPNILAIVASIVADKKTFLDMLQSSIIEVDDVYDVYLQAYNGNIDSGRLGELVFINGQRNGKLLQASKKVINALENRKQDPETHLLPYLGSLVPTASFDELIDILDFIEENGRLTRYPRYTITLTRAENITRILAHVKEGVEKRVKELMKERTQTVTLQQLTTDETIQELIENGARVDLLLELNEMKWVD